MKIILPAAFLALFLAAGAFAQEKSFFNDLKLSGAQIETCARETAGCQPNTFQLRGTRGVYSVEMTMSVDHARVDERLGGNNAARGNWSMAVSKAGKYIGTLFGDIVSGRVRFAKDVLTGVRTGRATVAGLRILGGRDGYREVEPNDAPTMMFSSFTNESLSYTEARLTDKDNAQ